MLSVTGSMQVTMETLRMREECVPGTPSEFSSAWERGYEYSRSGCTSFIPKPVQDLVPTVYTWN